MVNALFQVGQCLRSTPSAPQPVLASAFISVSATALAGYSVSSPIQMLPIFQSTPESLTGSPQLRYNLFKVGSVYTS